MKILNVVAIATLSMSLAGCVVSEQQFVKYREIIRTRPDLRAKVMAKCINDMGRYQGDRREAMAAMFDMNAATLPQSFCRRIERAYLSGRLTYQDYRDAAAHKPTARLVRIVRGK